MSKASAETDTTAHGLEGKAAREATPRSNHWESAERDFGRLAKAAEHGEIAVETDLR